MLLPFLPRSSTSSIMNKRKSSVESVEKPSKIRRTDGAVHGQEGEDDTDEEGATYQEPSSSSSVCENEFD